MSSFEERMQTACQDGTIPGAVVVATNASGSFKYQNAFGASVKPYEIDTPLKLMSCTKLITSIAALQCVDKGLIGVDDDVSKFLPTLGKQVLVEIEDGKDPVYEDLKTPVTLRLLLSHSSGAVLSSLNPALQKYRQRAGNAHLTTDGNTVDERFATPLGFQPGSAWQYGSGHDWAGKLVEVLSGQDLDSYIKANIAPQLGITTMTFWPQRNGLLEKIPLTVIREGTDNLKGIISGKKYDPTAKFIQLAHHDWDDVNKKIDCFGGSGLTASAPDYLKVLHSLLANDEKLLKPGTVDQLFTPTLSPAARKSLKDTWVGAGFISLAPGEYDANVGLDWGLGAMVTLDASEGWRGKGTLIWSGLVNLLWFVDRENDLCGIFATQVLPTGDDPTKKVITMWEKEMHRLNAEARGKA